MTKSLFIYNEHILHGHMAHKYCTNRHQSINKMCLLNTEVHMLNTEVHI